MGLAGGPGRGRQTWGWQEDQGEGDRHGVGRRTRERETDMGLAGRPGRGRQTWGWQEGQGEGDRCGVGTRARERETDMGLAGGPGRGRQTWGWQEGQSSTRLFVRVCIQLGLKIFYIKVTILGKKYIYRYILIYNVIYNTFIPFSVSLWKDLANPVFDGVGLAGFKSRANASLLA